MCNTAAYYELERQLVTRAPVVKMPMGACGGSPSLHAKRRYEFFITMLLTVSATCSQLSTQYSRKV